MATKIRLQRHGKKGKPFYHVVVADSRAPRDGKFIERLGSYNPNTNPATIVLNFDSALDWLNKGAQPTDTARAILSYKGVLYKKHLQGGVKKGAFDEAKAEELFAKWLESKEAKIEGKKSGLVNAEEEAKKAALAAEAKKNEERAAALAAKNAPVEEEAPAEEVTEEVVAEAPEATEAAESVEEATEVAPTTEEAPEEVVAEAPEVAEVVAEETTEEAPAEVATEDVVAEVEAPEATEASESAEKTTED